MTDQILKFSHFGVAPLEAKLQEKLGGKVLINEPLNRHTTMRVGGPARFFYRALGAEQICRAVQAALDLKLNYFLLGRGGNVVFSDDGFDGLVILNQADKISFFKSEARVLAESGIINSRLVYRAASEGLGGIEFLATIPGTLGGAVFSNAGAYGWEIGSFVKKITLLTIDGRAGKIKLVSRRRQFLQPGYRITSLKRLQKQRIQKYGARLSYQPLILSVLLQLQHKDQAQITRQIQALLKLRQARQPQGIISSGSIFKNPLGRPSGRQEDKTAIAQTAAYLLTEVGAKKVRVGRARVSAKQPNFITHDGRARAQEIKDLVERLQKLVQEKFGIWLEPEIEFIGQFKERSVEAVDKKEKKK